MAGAPQATRGLVGKVGGLMYLANMCAKVLGGLNPGIKGRCGGSVNSASCRDNDSQHSSDIIEDGQAPICYGPGRVRAPAARFTPYFLFLL